MLTGGRDSARGWRGRGDGGESPVLKELTLYLVRKAIKPGIIFQWDSHNKSIKDKVLRMLKEHHLTEPGGGVGQGLQEYSPKGLTV